MEKWREVSLMQKVKIMNKIDRKLYTIIYPFMSSTLGLSGAVKETFAVIFCFWISSGEVPIKASLTIIQTITGATRPTVVRALQILENNGLISRLKIPGKATLYKITIKSEILNKFKEQYKYRPVKRDNQNGLHSVTTSSQISQPQNNNKTNFKKVNTIKVKKFEEFRTNGLPEIK